MRRKIHMLVGFVPYLPLLPIKNIPIALGDKTNARKTRIAPASNTQRDRSESASKARLIPPPITIDENPAVHDTILQNPRDLTDEKIIDL